MSTLTVVFCPQPDRSAARFRQRYPDVDVRETRTHEVFGNTIFKDARHDALRSGKRVVLFWRQAWERLDETPSRAGVLREMHRLRAHPGVKVADHVCYEHHNQTFCFKGNDMTIQEEIASRQDARFYAIYDALLKAIRLPVMTDEEKAEEKAEGGFVAEASREGQIVVDNMWQRIDIKRVNRSLFINAPFSHGCVVRLMVEVGTTYGDTESARLTVGTSGSNFNVEALGGIARSVVAIQRLSEVAREAIDAFNDSIRAAVVDTDATDTNDISVRL